MIKKQKKKPYLDQEHMNVKSNFSDFVTRNLDGLTYWNGELLKKKKKS